MREQQIEALVDAVVQCLDDMGISGQSVCAEAKARLRVAVDPFLVPDHDGLDYPLEAAAVVLALTSEQ